MVPSRIEIIIRDPTSKCPLRICKPSPHRSGHFDMKDLQCDIKMGSRTFHPFCGSPLDGSPLYKNKFHPYGWFTSRMLHPSHGFSPGRFTPGRFTPRRFISRKVHPAECSSPGRFTPPKCSPPEMFTPSEYFSFSRRVKIMYKANQISG